MMNKKMLGLVGVLVVAVMWLTGCVASQLPNVKEAPVESSYRIGPGDQLNIYVRNNPDLSLEVPVRPDGNISIPLVENMSAAGKTPTQLADDLEASLKTYIRDPLVTVIVTSFVGTYQDQIRVVGEAAQPQSIPYRNGMTLLDVMIKVGGLTQFAAGNRAKLVREQDGKETTYSVQLQNLLGGDIDSNAPVRPGDVIIIPRAYF